MKLQIKDDAGKITTVSIANRNEITVGRKEGNTIRLTERNVSRSHARFIKKGDEVHVEDLSRYGTRVNGERIRSARQVGAGDIVQIGDYELSLEGAKAVEAGPADDKKSEAPARQPSQADLKKQKEIEEKARAQIAAAKAEALGGATAAAPAPKVEGTVSIQAVSDDGSRKSLGAGKKRIGAVHPTLVAVSSDIAGREYALTSKTMILGRTGENDIVIDHHSISRNHAKIVVENGAVKMVDLQSKNGIRVNGELWEESILKSGDVVELGKVQFRFVEKGEEFIYRPEDWKEGGRGPAAAQPFGDDAPKKSNRTWLLLLLLLVGGGVAAVFVITQKETVANNAGEVVAKPGGETPAVVKPAEPTPPPAAADVVQVAEVKPVEPAPAAVEPPKVEPTAAETVKDAMDKARAAVAAQNWAEALTHLEVVLALDKTNEDAPRLRDTVVREQKIGDALKAAQAAQLAQDLDGAWRMLGELGPVPETSVYHARVSELKNAVGPAMANARVADARGHLTRKQYVEAIQKGEEALALVPTHAEARDIVAKARKARAEQLKAEGKTVAANDPKTQPKVVTPPAGSTKTADELYKEARTYQNTDPAKALSLYQQAADKGHAAAFKQIGSIKMKQGDGGGALKAYEKYLKLAPSASDAETVRQIIAQLKGN